MIKKTVLSAVIVGSMLAIVPVTATASVHGQILARSIQQAQQFFVDKWFKPWPCYIWTCYRPPQK